jgi:alpha-amylase
LGIKTGPLAMQKEIKTPWLVVAVPWAGQAPPEKRTYHGDGRDILLQGFHWGSHTGTWDGASRSRKSWYRIVAENAAAIGAAGFTWVWLPPPSDSLAPQGYIPRRWNVLNSRYGTEAELKAAIRALGPVKALADVVLNHRVGAATGGADFEEPAFPDNRAAIVRNDSSGIGTGNPDTGECHPAGRDLDHTNPDVRAAVKSYLQRLKGVGFEGWRYDLAKGYHGRFVREYNDASVPGFSVGELFDGNCQRVIDWIDATGGKSTAFDFPTRYLLFDACRADDFGRLRSVHGGRVVPGGVIGLWPSRAVTFVDNHDTEYRRESEDHYPSEGTRHFPGGTADMAYAYILTHPGVPCVFWSHFFDWGEPTRRRIEGLMRVRQTAGIHACSRVDIKEAGSGLYAALIDDWAAVKLGSRSWWPGPGWQLKVDGDRLAVWTRS